MSRCFKASALALIILLAGACSQQSRIVDPSSTAPGSLKAFVNDILELHAKGDQGIELMLDHFEWTGVDAQTREAITRSLYFDLDTPILLIRIEPWTTDQFSSFFSDEAKPNLQPEWILHFHYDSEPMHVLSLPVGKSDGAFKIVNPIRPQQ